MSNKSKKNKYNIQQTDEYGQIENVTGMNVASDTDCTGMIPTPPQNCDEDDAYSDIYDLPPERQSLEANTSGRSKKKK